VLIWAKKALRQADRANRPGEDADKKIHGRILSRNVSETLQRYSVSAAGECTVIRVVPRPKKRTLQLFALASKRSLPRWYVVFCTCSTLDASHF
jgi:hypothetical protein